MGICGIGNFMAGSFAGKYRSDAVRSAHLERSGFVLTSSWNEDVLKNIDDVVDEIYRMLHPTEMRPSP